MYHIQYHTKLWNIQYEEHGLTSKSKVLPPVNHSTHSYVKCMLYYKFSNWQLDGRFVQRENYNKSSKLQQVKNVTLKKKEKSS